MRKFKLIKAYPGNENVDSVYESGDTFTPIINCLGKHINPLDFPENFKEVKDKEPLFITDDGVPMFDGDKYYGVDECVESFDSTANKNISYIMKDYKRFSTRVARDVYLANNKPNYSLNEVEKAIREGQFVNDNMDNFINEVKRRLIINKKNDSE